MLRSRSLAAALLAQAMLPIVTPLPALAQEQTEAQQPEKPVPSWTVSCSSSGAQGQLVCSLSQIILLKDSGQRVLSVTVGPEKSGLVLKLGLPHGLSLAKGVDIWIDKAKRQNHPIVTADQKGSYAMIPLDDGMVGALKQGTVLNVAVTAFAGSELVLQIPLAGFTAAFAKL